jgi:hypothetical protein
MFVVFNALSNGQSSQSIGDTLNRGTHPSSPALGAGASPESGPDSPAVVCYGNQLKITTNNSTLASVLAEVEKCTGAKIEIPEGAATSKVFNKLGPGPTRDVLASLLTSNGYDYVMGSSQSDPNRVETVLLLPRQSDAPTGVAPDNALSPTRSADLQMREDGKPSTTPAQVGISAATVSPDTMTKKLPAAELAVTTEASGNSSSPMPTALPIPVRSMETVAQTGMDSEPQISEVRWRDELTRFGVSANVNEDGFTNATGGANVSTNREELSFDPVSLRSKQDFPSSNDSLGPFLRPAVLQRQMPPSELAMIGDENEKLAGYVYSDPMNRDVESYLAEATSELRDRAKSPTGYAISLEELGETIWQADRRLGLVVPITFAIVILLIQMTVRSLMKTRIFLLAVPLTAIGAMWSLWFVHSNMTAALWVGIIALLSIHAEAGVFRLLYFQLARDQAKTRGDLRSTYPSAQERSKGSPQKSEPKVYDVLDRLNWFGFGKASNRHPLQGDEAN